MSLILSFKGKITSHTSLVFYNGISRRYIFNESFIERETLHSMKNFAKLYHGI